MLREKIESLALTAQTLAADVGALERMLANADGEIRDQIAQVESLRAQVAELSAKLSALTMERSDLLAQVDALKKRVADLENLTSPPIASYLWREDFQAMPREAANQYVLDIPNPISDYVRLIPAKKAAVIRVSSSQPFDASGARRRSEARQAAEVLNSGGTPKILVASEGSTRWLGLTIGIGVPETLAWRQLDGKVVLNQAHQASATDAINKLGPPYTLHVWGSSVDLIHCRSTPVAQNFVRTTLKRWPIADWLDRTRRIVCRITWDNRTFADGGKGSFDFWVDGELIKTSEAEAVRRGPQGHGVGGYFTCWGPYAVAFAATASPQVPPGVVEEILYARCLVGDERNKFEDFA